MLYENGKSKEPYLKEIGLYQIEILLYAQEAPIQNIYVSFCSNYIGQS